MKRTHWMQSTLITAGLALSLCACGYTEQTRTFTPEMKMELSVWQTQGAEELEPNLLLASSKEMDGLRYELVMNQGYKIEGQDAEPHYAIWDCENCIGYCELRAYQNDALVGQLYLPELMFFQVNHELNPISIPFELHAEDYNGDGTPEFALCQAYTDGFAVTDLYCYDGKDSFRNLLGNPEDPSTAGWLFPGFDSFSPKLDQIHENLIIHSAELAENGTERDYYAICNPKSGQYDSLTNMEHEPVTLPTRADVAAMPSPIPDPFYNDEPYVPDEELPPVAYPELKTLQPLTASEETFCKTAAKNLFAALDELMGKPDPISSSPDWYHALMREDSFLIATDLDENKIPEVFCFWYAGGTHGYMNSAVYTFDADGNCRELTHSLGDMHLSRLYPTRYALDDNFTIERNGQGLVAHIINQAYVNPVSRRTPCYDEYFVTYDGTTIEDHGLEWQRSLTFPFHAEWTGFRAEEEPWRCYTRITKQEYLAKRDQWKGEPAEDAICECVYMHQLPEVELHTLCLRTLQQFYCAAEKS